MAKKKPAIGKKTSSGLKKPARKPARGAKSKRVAQVRRSAMKKSQRGRRKNVARKSSSRKPVSRKSSSTKLASRSSANGPRSTRKTAARLPTQSRSDFGGPREAGKISDSAVLKATGKVWIEWFALLDAAGASVLSHADIAEYLRRRHGVGDWWGQMVTVAYEQARGLRQKHQKPDGFEISVSKTLPVSVAVAFEHWYDTVQRSRWLADSAIKIRKATANKSMRIDWIDARTRLSLNFVPRGNDRSQVVVQHMKLPDSDAAARMKRYWYDQLEKLNALLAGADSTPASPNAGSMNIPMD